jgi:hypothetical protein
MAPTLECRGNKALSCPPLCLHTVVHSDSAVTPLSLPGTVLRVCLHQSRRDDGMMCVVFYVVAYTIRDLWRNAPHLTYRSLCE